MCDKFVVITDYLKYRAELRGFDINRIEDIVRYSQERYFDSETHRTIAIGEHDQRLVIVPYEENEFSLVPVTIHATTRQQIKFRLTTGRFVNA